MFITEKVFWKSSSLELGAMDLVMGGPMIEFDIIAIHFFTHLHDQTYPP